MREVLDVRSDLASVREAVPRREDPESRIGRSSPACYPPAPMEPPTSSASREASWPWRSACAFALALSTACGPSPPEREFAPRPNILLISVDTLRPDRLGAYGAPRETSPTIDRLAAEGVLFRNAFSPTSWTLPAHMTLMTSLDGSVHGVDVDWVRLDAGHETLAEILQREGYATAGFYSGPYLHSSFGFGRGFDVYESCMEYDDRFPEILGESEDAPLDDVFERLRTEVTDEERTVLQEIDLRSHSDRTSARVVESASSWLSAAGDRPAFLFLHFFDAHYDFLPPPPFDGLFGSAEPPEGLPREGFIHDRRYSATMPAEHLEWTLAQYDGEIRWVDENVRRILGAIADAGPPFSDRPTVVALVSDHGEEFFEHGHKGHRRTLFDEVLRIPLILHAPDLLPAGAVQDSQVRLADVAPTLLELAGIDVPEGFVGRSLVSLARRPDVRHDLPALGELRSIGPDGEMSTLRSLRLPPAKIVVEPDGHSAAYDLDADPAEQSPLAPDETPELAALHGRLLELAAALDSVARGAEDRAVDVDDDLRRRLVALGYVDG